MVPKAPKFSGAARRKTRDQISPHVFKAVSSSQHLRLGWKTGRCSCGKARAHAGGTRADGHGKDDAEVLSDILEALEERAADPEPGALVLKFIAVLRDQILRHRVKHERIIRIRRMAKCELSIFHARELSGYRRPCPVEPLIQNKSAENPPSFRNSSREPFANEDQGQAKGPALIKKKDEYTKYGMDD